LHEFKSRNSKKKVEHTYIQSNLQTGSEINSKPNDQNAIQAEQVRKNAQENETTLEKANTSHGLFKITESLVERKLSESNEANKKDSNGSRTNHIEINEQLRLKDTNKNDQIDEEIENDPISSILIKTEKSNDQITYKVF
jgi:hypothetical protein